MEHQWNDIYRGEPKYWEKNLSKFHCVHKKPHKDMGSNPSLRRQRLSHGMTLQTTPPPLQSESTFPSNAARFQRVLLLFWKVASTTGSTLSLCSVPQTSLDNRRLTTYRPYCKVVFAPHYTRSEVYMMIRIQSVTCFFTTQSCLVSCYKCFERINCLLLQDMGKMFLRNVSRYPANTR